MDSSCKANTYACFSCRKHRRLLENAKYKRDTVSCPQCQQPMNFIGCRLQVPRKDNADAWDKFWLQYISPGYGPKGVIWADAENEHFQSCKAKKRQPPRESESTGCDKCDVVWTRLPEEERERWRRRWPYLWTGTT